MELRSVISRQVLLQGEVKKWEVAEAILTRKIAKNFRNKSIELLTKERIGMLFFVMIDCLCQYASSKKTKT